MSTTNRISAVWIDQGGTCQDRIIVSNDGYVRIEKYFTPTAVPTCEELKKGTTVATNALLERTTPRILVITNEGLGDLLWIGDQRRAELFDPFAHRTSLIKADILEVKTRTDAQGQVLYHTPISPKELQPYIEKNTAIAIVFVHSHRNANTERSIAEQCENIGFQHVRMGHQIANERGFVDRLRSTAIDAALAPLIPREKALYMRSDGGLADHNTEEWSGVNAVLSGPAGGAMAVATLAKKLALSDVFGLDMGGTSADVCHFSERVRMRDHLPFDSWDIRVPTIDIETVAAGGGSLLRVVDGVAQVGPRSAGADPGPACYGRGGRATLCDCDAILGFLPVFPDVCGPNYDQPLNRTKARETLAQLLPRDQKKQSFVLERLAVQFQRLAAEQMGNAILKMAAMRGIDPATHSLVAYGGSGPAHACRVALRLGMKRIVIPFFASVFSALGIGEACRKKHQMEPVIDGDIMTAYQTLQNNTSPSWSRKTRYRVRAAYEKTDGMIELDWYPNMDLHAAFHQQHQQQLGFSRMQHNIEVVLLIRYDEEEKKTRDYSLQPKYMSKQISVFMEDCWQEINLWGRSSVPEGLVGPALIALDGAMLVVEPGWTIHTEKNAFVLTREQEIGLDHVPSFSMIQAAIFSGRIASIAERMGGMLLRLARSVSIRERRDFSCAIFDAQGNLVANAPHVPVHLGSMSAQLKHFLSVDKMHFGEVWIGNDPYYGGAHLPDITAFSPVFFHDRLLAFVGCRGHHIDIGGIQPGSMPPHSRHIEEEGIRLSRHCLFNGAQYDWPNLEASRKCEDVKADLEGQVEACLYGVRLVQELAKEGGLANGFASMLEHAKQASLRWLKENKGTYKAVEIREGLRIEVQLVVEKKRGILRIHAPADEGNRNTPRGVVAACLLYLIRSSIDEEIPLNAGFLDCWTIQVNPGGLFDPQYPRAVVGGNVETSQILVDIMRKAMGKQASSQGTMNNLCISCGNEVLYETLGGGAGAGADQCGGSAVQVHMTNTQATDVEVVEERMPVRITKWAVRKKSGGKGMFYGGDGMVKEWLFLDNAEVSLLASQRSEGARGYLGGGAGLAGKDMFGKNGEWFPLTQKCTVQAGEKCRILTPGGGGFGGMPVNEEDR